MLTTIRGSIVSLGILDSLQVQNQPISHLSFYGKNNQSIWIEPYDVKLIPAIVEIINNAGFSSYPFSKTRIIVSVPPPIKDQKTKIINHIKRVGEEHKVSIRNIRKNYRNKLTKVELSDLEPKIQNIVNLAINEIDSLIKNKTNEL